MARRKRQLKLRRDAHGRFVSRNPTFKTGKPKPGTSAAGSKRRGIVDQDTSAAYTIKQTGKHAGVIKNPQGRQYKKAVSLYRDFTGENPRHVDDWDVLVPNVAMEVGKVTGIMYKARVDGKVQEFLHEFTGRSRPILAASSDGRQLLLLGGDYKMTERGIVDGTYEFVR